VTPTLVGFRRASPTEWDRFWTRCPVATYFQSRAWSEIWRDATGGKLRPWPRIAEFDDGREVLLAITHHRRLAGLAGPWLLSPGETFGGWLRDEPLSRDHVDRLVERLTARRRGLFWKIGPYDADVPREGPHVTEQDETQRLALGPDFDRVRRGWTKGHRAAARRAEREGVRVRLADRIEDWKAYRNAYEDSLRRWGDRAFTRHEWPLFEAMARRSTPSHDAADVPALRLWLAERDGQILAGAVVLYSPLVAVYWHGAAFERHFPLQPVHAVIAAAIRHACETGHAWFDFNPSGPLEGVRAFKKGFGATVARCPNVRVEPARPL